MQIDFQLILAGLKIHTVAGDYTFTNGTGVVVNKASGAATNVNLPIASASLPVCLFITDGKGDAASNNITIVPNGAATINGASSYVINIAYGSVILVSTPGSTNWNIFATYGTASGGSAVFTGITANTITGGADPFTITGLAGSGSGNGGAIVEAGGAGVNATSGTGTNGGAWTGKGGVAGTATSGTGGNGGAATVSGTAGGAATTGTGGNGGATTITAGPGGAATGAAGTGGTGGATAISSGAGGAASNASNTAAGVGGAFSITGGAGGASSTTANAGGAAGTFSITGGAGGAGAAAGTGGAGAAVAIAAGAGGNVSGAGTSGAGGAISVTGGAAGTNAAGTGAAGGAASLIGGPGSTAGAGGAITITSGAAGATGVAGAVNISVGGATAGAGSALTLTAGNGAGGTAAGGNLNLVAGTAVSTGAPGEVQINSASGFFEAVYAQGPATVPTTSTSYTLFMANRAYRVKACRVVASTAGGSGCTVTVTKDTGAAAAPGSGTALLGAPASLAGTAGTVVNPALITTVATLTLAAGDRLSTTWAGTISPLAGAVVSVLLEPC